MSSGFVHLHLHSEYSLVDSVVRIKPLVKAAAAAGMPAVAVTDVSNLFAAVKFYKAATAAGIKPIIGADVWLRRGPDEITRLVLLCQNDAGYRNLTRLVSRSYIEGRQRDLALIDFNWLTGATDGLIALSAGRDGDLGRALLNGNTAQAERYLDDWQRLFPERFYLEVQRTGRPNEERYLQAAVDLAIAHDLPVVATNDVRFLSQDDFEAHEARVCIHQGRTLNDNRRSRDYSTEQYLRTPADMAERFADLPEALENSIEIAKRCNLTLELGKSVLPDFPIPADLSAEDYFAQQARDGLEARLQKLFKVNAPDFATRRQPYDERLTTELAVIQHMGFAGYFLIVADFIRWAKDNGIPVGPGRGSGAGSLVAYALGITDLDPLAYDLLFERFLNPERVSMPDFDVDFCMEGRDRVIDYVARHYGRDKVSQIATYGTMAAKAVVRDVGRVLGQPYGFVDKIAKLVPFEVGMTLDKALEQEPELARLHREDEEVRALLDLALKLEGLARSVGKHAGGVVIAPSALTDFSPLYCEDGSDAPVTQFDKDDVEAVGLVKFDFLGLRTLTIIDWALQTINAQRKNNGEEPLDITTLPLKDRAAYELLKRCETTAVFQLESRGMKDLIRRLQPDRFEDIIALVALFRPGPLQSGMVDDFINRKHGRAEVAYPHPDLEPVLEPTYGVILYQEQVMQIAQVLASYTLGGADLLRRCLSGSTEVMDAATGRLVSLREIAAHQDEWLGREVFTLNLQTQKIDRQPISAIYANGVRGVWEITTKTQRKIRATAEHLFYTLNGWKPLAAFNNGDRIGLARTLPIIHDSTVSDAQIKLTAYLLGDGHLSTRKPSNSYFCNSDPELIADFNNCAESLFGAPAPVDYQVHEGHKTVAYARIGCVSAFNRWVDHHLKRAHSRDKVLPEWIFQLSRQQLQLFLGTLWSTDGSFDKSLGHTDYTSTSERMIRQIQHLLLRLGIVALFNIKRIHYQGKPHVSYRAQITGREDMLRFYDLIAPFLSQYKQKTAQMCYLLIKDKTKNQSKHTIPPAVITLIATAKQASGMTWADIDHAVGATRGAMSSGLNFQTIPTRSLARHRVYNFAVALQNRELQAIAESEVFWDVITSIDYIGEEDVYDLTIPQHHNFIANDFIAHNCMGKKKPEEMAQQRTIFTEGALQRGVDAELSNYIFDLMEKFAGYGFNKSHSAAYALVSYQTAWLKAHYPAAFMAAVLSSDMDKTDKVVTFIEECRRMKLNVAPPSVNRSVWRFAVGSKDNEIIYGLGAIKGAGEGAIENLLTERRNGVFKDLYDFCRRIDLRKFNRRVLEALIRSGACDELGPNRATLMQQLPDALHVAEQDSRNAAVGQNDLFGLADNTVVAPVRTQQLATLPEWDDETRLNHEKATLGLYLTGHPIDRYKAELKHFISGALADVLDDDAPAPTRRGRDNNKTVTVAGLVVEVRTRNGNRGGRMAFVTLDDGTKRTEIRIFSEKYELYRELIEDDKVLVVRGDLSYDEFAGGLRLNVDKLFDIDGARNEFARRLLLHLSAPDFRINFVNELAAVLAPYRQGQCPIGVYYTRPGARAELVFDPVWRVRPTEELLRRLRELLNGAERVALEY